MCCAWLTSAALRTLRCRRSIKCAFTIHNLNYGADLIGKAMAAADVCTTVGRCVWG